VTKYYLEVDEDLARAAELQGTHHISAFGVGGKHVNMDMGPSVQWRENNRPRRVFVDLRQLAESKVLHGLGEVNDAPVHGEKVDVVDIREPSQILHGWVSRVINATGWVEVTVRFLPGEDGDENK
jgi:hypothetical protein